MNMKMVNLFLSVWMICCLSCQKQTNDVKQIKEENPTEVEEPTEIEEPEEEAEPIELMGTKWKLVGVVGGSNVKELKPKDCEECYTLTFVSDYEADVFSVNPACAGKLDLTKLNPDMVMEYYMFCEKYPKDGIDYCDSDDFRIGITYAGSYTVSSQEFKLFTQHSKTNYLLFKPIEE